MATKTYTRQMLNILHILSWIIFVGLCIEAGGFLVGAFFTLAKPAIVKNLWIWQEVDLSALFNYDQNHFFGIALLMSVVAWLKALLFFLIIKILLDKKLDMIHPFNKGSGRFIFNISYLSLLIGLFSWIGVMYTEWLDMQGVSMPGIQHSHLGGSDVWLFMGIILLIIAQMFKRGIEIQSENDLTI